jgi:hypothetical protein
MAMPWRGPVEAFPATTGGAIASKAAARAARIEAAFIETNFMG